MKSLPVRYILLLAVLTAITLVGSIGATTSEEGDDVRITALHEIDDDFYAFSQKIGVDGIVNGDFFGFGMEAAIKGNIGGSGNFICRYVDHNGRIDGSLRFLGERLTVTGRVGGSIVAGGSSVIIRQGSIVEKDVDLAAGEIDLEGTVLGRAKLEGGMVRVASPQIGGDLDIEAERITIVPPTVIRGNLIYRTEEEDQLTLEPGVTVIGETTWAPPELEEEESTLVSDIAYAIANLLAAFIFGVLVMRLFRPYAEESIHQLRDRTSVALAAGLLVVLALIMAALVLGLSLLGSILGAVLLEGELAFMGLGMLVLSLLALPISSFATISGAIVLYSGKIVVGLVLGYLVLRLLGSKKKTPGKAALFVGLIVLTLAAALPYVGLVLYFLTMFIGAGAIALGIYRCRHAPREDS